MAQPYHVAFSGFERVLRGCLGTILLLLAFTVALTISTTWFATMNFIAMYPLFTALVAWDPIYLSIETMKQYSADIRVFN